MNSCHSLIWTISKCIMTIVMLLKCNTPKRLGIEITRTIPFWLPSNSTYFIWDSYKLKWNYIILSLTSHSIPLKTSFLPILWKQPRHTPIHHINLPLLAYKINYMHKIQFLTTRNRQINHKNNRKIRTFSFSSLKIFELLIN